MKKRVLIISYSYPPSNAPAAQRPYAFAKFLDKNKYKVTVLTCLNQDSSLGFDRKKDENINEVELLKVKSLVGSGVGKELRSGTMAEKKTSILSSLKLLFIKTISKILIPDKAIFWYPKVLKYLKPNTYDVVISTSPMFTNHLIAYKLKKKDKKVKWIADFRDYHYLANLSVKKGIKPFLNKIIESRIVKKADELVFISYAMAEVYKDYYHKFKNKINVVYNGFDLDDFKNNSIEEVTSKKLSFFYAGSFYKGVRSPFPLFKLLDVAAKENLINLEDVEVNIAGNFEQDFLEKLQDYKSYKCLNLLGRIDRNEVLKRLTNTHVLWLIVGEKLSHYSGVPLKFYEYMASRRPILNFAPDKSEPTKIIKEHNLGWSIDVNNEDLNKQLIVFKDLIDEFNNNTLGQPLNDLSLKKYSRITQTEKMQELF